MSEPGQIQMPIGQKWYGLFSKTSRDGRFANSVSWVGMRAISGLARLGILLAIARAYGPESFGRLSLAVSIVEILRMFSEFGIDTISIRRFTLTEPIRRADLLQTVMGAKLLLSTCFYCAGMGALFLLASNRSEALLGLVAGLSLFFANALGAFSSYLQSFFSISRIFRTSLISSVISITFAWLAIHAKASVLLVIVALPLGDALNLLLFCLSSNLPLKARFDFRETLSLLRESLPVGITSALIILYFRIDTLFVFKFAGAAALGLYSACFRITEPALLIPHAFSTTAYAVLSSAERQNDRAGAVVRTLVRTMWPAFVAVGGFALSLLLGGTAILTSFFPRYLAAYPIMVILSITLLVRSVNMGLTAIFNSRAKYSTITRVAAINLGINLVLVMFLARKFGALGAAWAALLTESLNSLIQVRSLVSVLSVPKHALLLGNVDLEA